jgi:hypothetical protein
LGRLRANVARFGRVAAFGPYVWGNGEKKKKPILVPQLVLLGLEPLEDHGSRLVGLKNGLKVFLNELVTVSISFLQLEDKLEHLKNWSGALQNVHSMLVRLARNLGNAVGQKTQDGGALNPVMIDNMEEALPRI